MVMRQITISVSVDSTDNIISVTVGIKLMLVTLTLQCTGMECEGIVSKTLRL